MNEKLKSLERTRNLLVWLDNSTVANSGYLVCLVTCLYDPAVFYTDDEYEVKFGRKVGSVMVICLCELLKYDSKREATIYVLPVGSIVT